MMLLALFVTVVVLYTVDATNCRECMAVQVTSDDPFMEMILQSMFDSMNHPQCRDNPERVPMTQCPSKCGTIDANMDMTVETMFGDVVGVDMTMMIRGCVDEGGPLDTENGCHDVEDIEDSLVAGMQLGSEATVNDVSGDYCVCDRSNCNTD